MANYTVRDNTRQISVVVTGGPGSESWTVTAAPPFTFQHFRETGSGSKLLTGPIIDGREYEITVDPISGYDIVATPSVVAGPATQTFQVLMSAQGATGDLTITLSPDFGQGWTVTGPSYPSGFSGNGSTVLSAITQGQYQISYDDDRIHLVSPPGDSMSLGTAATFTGAYTIRNDFAVNVTVLDDGSTPTGAFGTWDITNDEGFGFAATGDWDTNNSPVAPSLGDFYEGRAYTLDFTDEIGYTPLPNQAITAAGTYIGNYQMPVSGACDAFIPDASVSGDTWSPAVALTPSSSTSATADFYLQPTAQNQGALIGFAKNTPIWDYSDCVALIRFNDLGTSRIDVRDGGAYCSDGAAPSCTANISYTAGHWYHFVVDFDITNKRYTVRVEDCNDGLVVLHQSAAFRTDAAPNDDAIGYWALNAFDANLIHEYGMQWDAEGTTPPTTGSISINVTPETGNWTLNGPNFYQEIGTGDRTLSSLAFGDYTIIYGSVGGYDPPATNPDNVTLSSGNPTHTFLGTYQSTGTQTKNIYGIGHSLLGNDMDILTLTRRVVETAGHSATTKEQNQPGAPLQYNWDNSSGGFHNDGRADIATGVYDQIIMVENSGVQEGGTGGSITAAGLWRDLGLSSYADTPDCQAFLFTTWNDRTGANPDPVWRGRFNHISTWGPDVVAGVNANNGASPSMQLIPLGPTYMAALYDDIYNSGSAIYASGLTNIAQVFSDTVHLNTIGRYFQALVFAAHIYGMDVRGANISYLNRWNSPMPTPHPTASQATALQNLVHSIWSS